MLHAVIMAGGSGTRFWPASRRSRPKQFLNLAGEVSLLRATYERIAPLVPPDRVWVVTAEHTAGLTRELLPELPGDHVIGEPCGRDTAACVGLASQVLLHGDPEAVSVVLPADHLVADAEGFRAAMAAGAAHVAADGGLLTFGIRPTAPETGYGYLAVGSLQREVSGFAVHVLERFVEKPDLETARSYLAAGGYLWNSGMFAWRAADLLSELERQRPALAAGIGRIAATWGTAGASAALAAEYPGLERISIDFGVMENAARCWTVPVEFPWSDVGSWSALPAARSGDADGNVTAGRVVTVDAHDNVIISHGPLVALAGVRNSVVVATPDAVLVVPLAEAQRVKDLVGELERRGWGDVL